MTALKHDPARQPAEGRLFTARGGAARGLSDLLASTLRALLEFTIWFFAGTRMPALVLGRRRVSPFLVIRVGLVLLLGFVAYGGMLNPVLTGFSVALVVLVASYAFIARSYARDRMFIAATRELEGTAPLGPGIVSAPAVMAARALQELTLGVDRVRRGDGFGARAAVAEIDEERLEPDERRMLLAIRALAASSMHDHKLAVLLAIGGFPTGAAEIDERIGRLCFEGAFHDGTRLQALLEAWDKAGLDVTDVGPLAEMQRLASLKLCRLEPSSLPPAERKAAAQYARALGDLELERTLLDSSGEAASRYR